jgi:hypothetical protein
VASKPVTGAGRQDSALSEGDFVSSHDTCDTSGDRSNAQTLAWRPFIREIRLEALKGLAFQVRLKNTQEISGFTIVLKKPGSVLGFERAQL